MEFISESIIEEVLKNLESEENGIAEGFEQMAGEQQAFVQYLASENLKILKENEYDLLVFVLVVIYQSSLNQLVDPTGIQAISSETIESLDEENWELFNEDGAQNYSKALDVFFKGYAQEDLLAFVEDALVHDDNVTAENELITQVGKEIIFITSKTFIDCLSR